MSGGRNLNIGRKACEWLRKLVIAVVPRRVLYRAEEAVVLLRPSRSQLYELIRSGRVPLQFAPHVSKGLPLLSQA